METIETVSSEAELSNSLSEIASDKGSPTKKSKTRYVYSKIELLNLRDCKESLKEPDESTIFANSKIILKVLKPECKLVQKLSKSQDHSGIVLGPQKRSWNIGCHVSQPKRNQNEVSTVTKQAKNFGDRPFTRGSDSRRDQKYNERTSPTSFRGKDKNYNNQNNHSGFLRSYGKSDNRNRDRNDLTHEKEPEWFSEGPETINDTIELVGMNDNATDFSKEHKPPTKVTPGIPQNASLSPSEEDVAILSVDVEQLKTKALPESLANSTDVDFLKLLDVPKSDSSGSHFRHLFNKDVKNTSNCTGTLNSKLLQLLACSGDQPSNLKASRLAQTPTNHQNSASDLESALRSILLGNQNPSLNLNSNNKPSIGNSRNVAPTVEEIEAATLASTTASKSSSHAADMLSSLPMQDKDIVELNRIFANPRSWNMKNMFSQVDGRNTAPGKFDRSQPSMLQPPMSLSALESIQNHEQPSVSKLLGHVTSIAQSRASPGMTHCSNIHSGVPRDWDDVLKSSSSQNNLLLNGLLNKMGRPSMQNLLSSSYMQSTSCVMSSVPFSDPAIQSSTRRPIVKTAQSDNEAQMRSSLFNRYGRDQPTGPPPSMNPQNLRDFEAALFQLNSKTSTSGGSSGVGLYQQPTPGSFFSSHNRPMMTPMQLGCGKAGGNGDQHISNGTNTQLLARQASSGGGMKPNYSAPSMLSQLQQQSRWLEHNNHPASCSSSDIFCGPGLRGDEV